MSNVPVAFVALVCGEPWIFSSPIHLPVSFSSLLCCSVGFGCSIRSSNPPQRDDELDIEHAPHGACHDEGEATNFEDSGRVASETVRRRRHETAGASRTRVETAVSARRSPAYVAGPFRESDAPAGSTPLPSRRLGAAPLRR